jgi:hypothetical protein
MSEEVKPASKKTAKKASAKKVDTAPKAEEKPSKVFFYFPKSRGASYSWREGDKVRRCKAVNRVITLDPSNDDDAYMIEKFRADRANQANGGAKFVEVSDKAAEATDAGTKIELLMEMDFNALVTMLGGDIELLRLKKGDLIAKALGM